VNILQGYCLLALTLYIQCWCYSSHG